MRNCLRSIDVRVRLVSIDIEGCLIPRKGGYIDLNVLREMRTLDAKSRKQPDHPRLTLCSGRAQPFVEAMIGIIGGWTPAVCENGGIIYDPLNDVSLFHPKIDEKQIKKINDLREFLSEYILNIFPGTRFEIGKETMLSLNPPSILSIKKLHEHVRKITSEKYDGLIVTRSKSAVDINLPQINKLEGMKFITHSLGFSTKEVCAIGDSMNDLEILKGVGFPAAPFNAEEAVKKNVSFVSSLDNGEGVIDIIRQCIKNNRK